MLYWSQLTGTPNESYRRYLKFLSCVFLTIDTSWLWRPSLLILTRWNLSFFLWPHFCFQLVKYTFWIFINDICLDFKNSCNFKINNKVSSQMLIWIVVYTFLRPIETFSRELCQCVLTLLFIIGMGYLISSLRLPTIHRVFYLEYCLILQFSIPFLHIRGWGRWESGRESDH